MGFPSQTTGLGVAAKIAVQGNESASTTPGYNNLVLSVSGVGAPSSFQLNPQLQDVKGNEVTLGTAFTLTAVANSSTTALVLTAAAVNGVYTGTITGGASNALAGTTFIVAGFTNAANNGEFIATASSATTLTLANANSVVETHAGTATYEEGTAVYTGTITGGATALTLTAASIGGVYTGTITGGAANALAGATFIVTGFTNAKNNGQFIATASTATVLTLGNDQSVAETHAGTATSTYADQTFVVAGFAGANNNGTFIATASSATTLTLENAAATAETHAATATGQELTADLTYVEYGFKNVVPSQATGPNGSPVNTNVATVSASGLVTAVAQGGTVVEVSYPTFNNTVGDVVSPGNIMNGLPINKVYAEVNVTVLP
jgi:hypothetical protein